MGRNRNYNPVEAHRKAMHKREVKKHKEERRKQRESKLATANLTELREQVEQYTVLEANDRLDAASRKKFEQAKSRLQKATKVQQASARPVTNMQIIGMLTRYMQELRQNRPRTDDRMHADGDKDARRDEDEMPSSEGGSASDTDSQEDSESDAASDDMPELPPDSPPEANHTSREDGSDGAEEEDLPDLPEGTPPPLPEEVEERANTRPGPPMHYPMRPPAYPPMHYPPPPPPPPHMMYDEPYQLFPQAQPPPPPPPPPRPAAAASMTATNATISAQPQLRDLHKELTTLVPTAVRRKREGTTGGGGGGGGGRHPREEDSGAEPSLATKRMRINTAPGLDPEHETPAAATVATTAAAAARPAAQPSSTRLQDEYSNFMKEMEGLL
ncbi:hypothetical protein SYNPS1DRAFT_27312 [Syncephalis pseudoplumigaleata]|uniref:Wbp11/ELF5/Saf1 N-terminal domain-containing protein n=1 Tax=Syncephalis pseudoplumigaleata TaxID=1712513 RepID=A0A4P9Z3J2_9FUNG|nr:hypothetical protein SYNPS1DRAFT_27312 [Syncephalis pseudoplumigaleata]|eukprot:RKP27026.1 hypothetical protein SYNPS1DRAFT_27312 [Syncephalis pseudoplumigaleata]